MSGDLPNDPPGSGGKKGKSKRRLDLLLVERGLAQTQEQAQRLIMAGDVRVNDVVVVKAGSNAPVGAVISVRPAPPFVSRGGLKLVAALDEFHLDVAGFTAVDVGASTGGFTDCLLQRGAAHVFAVDVGYGQLAWKLRSDPRITLLERTNIRFLEQLPGGALVDLAVIDASFIGLRLTLPAALRFLKPAGQVIALVKPQFEAARAEVGQGGVVRNIDVQRRVLDNTVELAASLALDVAGVAVSPAPGAAGNVEFLLWLRRTLPIGVGAIDAPAAINNALMKAADMISRL